MKSALLRTARQSTALPRRFLASRPSTAIATNLGPHFKGVRFFANEAGERDKKDDWKNALEESAEFEEGDEQLTENFDFGEDAEVEATIMPDPNNVKGETKEAEASNESRTGELHQMEFQAETRRILNIVANSLYTDKEVFLRELISNASDALEKARYVQTHKTNFYDGERPLEIHINADVDNHTLTIQDYGVGMTKDELISNLGTIARSGSKHFVESLSDSSTTENIIGQFGVGFYSVFMIADKVEVYTQPCETEEDGAGQQAWYWKSDGSGAYEIAEADQVVRGTKIIAHLKEDAQQFSVRLTLEGIIKKYSNFVGFPIYLNGEEVNTIDAIWTRSKNTVTEDEHTQFYRYISNAFDTPPMRMHFTTDVPLAINALFYMPERHMEKFGMGRMDPGVGLYSRKVLIQPKCKQILPDWLRFIKGVVDSEDLPLNISRENMQDSALISRINSILTKRVIKFLETEAKKEPDKFNRWLEEFEIFLKEGVCTDFTHKAEIARLLRFDSSRALGEDEKRNHISLDQYIASMPVGQNNIYYLNAPNREFALASPYYESFAEKGTEVLFLYNSNIDDFVMKNLATYETRKLISIESAEAHESKSDDSASFQEMIDFVQESLSDRVSSVTASTRLSKTPAIVVDHESAAVRRMMKYVDASQASAELPKQKLEVNPSHPVMKNAYEIRWSNPALATLVLQQVYDNALIAADILDNPRSMLTRLNSILEAAANPGHQDAEVEEAEDSKKE